MLFLMHILHIQAAYMREKKHALIKQAVTGKNKTKSLEYYLSF